MEGGMAEMSMSSYGVLQHRNMTDSQNMTPPVIAGDAFIEEPLRPIGNLTGMGTTERALWTYVSLFLLIPGIIGNVLTVILMSRKKFANGTTSWYLTALAVSDTGVLLSGLLRRWLSAAFDFDWRTLSTSSCRVGVFTTYVFCHISAWMVVAVTMERLIVVKLPHKIQTLVTKRNAAIVLILTTVLSVCLDNHFLWSFDYHVHEFRGRTVQRCHVMTEYEHYFYDVYAWLDMCAYSVLPSCFLFVGNICILVRHAKVKMKIHKVQSLRQGLLAQPWMTTTLLCLSFSFIITTLPQPIGFVIYYSLGSKVRD